MNSANFSKSFRFNIFNLKKFHVTDHTKKPIPLHYFGYIIKGTAEITAKNEKLELKPNDIFYIPKGLNYQSQWFGEEITFYSFGFEISPINKSFVLQKIHCSEKAQEIFHELCKEIPFTDKGIGKLYYFFGLIADGMKQRKNPATNSVMEKAIEYMTENPNCKISDIARRCNVSTSYIYCLFKKHLNKTPNDIRLEILCEKAILLLATTDKTVQEISDILAFSSTSYFRKILKAYAGKTPREIRKNAKGI